MVKFVYVTLFTKIIVFFFTYSDDYRSSILKKLRNTSSLTFSEI